MPHVIHRPQGEVKGNDACASAISAYNFLGKKSAWRLEGAGLVRYGVDMAHIEIRHLSFTYPHAHVPALADVNLDIAPGSLVLLGGKSGSGKSTLLSQFMSPSSPEGQRSGTILIDGVPLEDMSPFSRMSKIAFVSQKPDAQIGSGKVMEELTRHLIRINCEQSTMRSRVAETAAYFGIENWLDRDVDELSDGQKQLLKLASAMVLNPRVLVFDDPVSQLDAVTAASFLTIVYDLNSELRTTVIMSTRIFDEIYQAADIVAVMDAGKIRHLGTPRDVVRSLYRDNDQFVYALPSSVRIYHGVHPRVDPRESPLSVGEARDWMKAEYEAKGATLRHLPDKRVGGLSDQTVMRFEDVGFGYDGARAVFKGLSLSVSKGGVHAVVGANGSGKSTLLKMAAGNLAPDRGLVSIHDGRRGRWVRASQCASDVALLPQDLDGFFARRSVRAELEELVADRHFTQEDIDRYVDDFAKSLGISAFLDEDPGVLSYGERQLAGIAMAMMRETAILLLDEPAKGVDLFAQRKLGKLLHELAKRGVAILIASQDLKFCAEYATSVSLIFDGEIVTTETPQAFFSSNVLYTTQASRISRGVYSNTVTDDDVIVLCLENGWQKQ